MTIALTVDELLRFTGGEREKWRGWFVEHAGAIDAPVQPAGRLPTVGKLVDHIFLAERRTLQRLSGEPAADKTGLSGTNAPPLFDFGASVRRELEQYVANLGEDEADELRTFAIADRQWPLTPRKLLFHILLHEIRHWAQVTLAVRLAGFEPPGDHDLIHSKALR